MKKVCVSTFCEWSSYGSVVQALGMKKTLKNLGLDSFIIRDCPAPVSKRDFPFVLSKNPKVLLRNLINLKFRKHQRTLYENSVKFINENADIFYYNDYEALLSNPPKADYYLAGSDQIWHPALCKKVFFLDFLGSDQKRLSYGASMGVTTVPENKKEDFGKLISKMDSVSVREREMTEVLGQYFDKEVTVHIDPTFLIDSKEWSVYEREYKINKPYILVYTIYWDKHLNKELIKLKKNTGYDIVALCPSGISSVWANKKIFDADVGQFLFLIDNAEAVVSSSFHGVALSINFNKKVAAVVNPAAPSRINTLLETLSVNNPGISGVVNFDLTDYSRINRKIKEERDRSVKYLKEILEISE